MRACNHLGVMIDVSHLNEKGFWDVARLEHGAFGGDALVRARDLPFDKEPDR